MDTTTNTDLGQAAVVNGVATLTTDQLASIGWGEQADITAYYGGDINFFAANSGSSVVTVVPATTTSLEASPTVALSGQAVTMTATVAVAPGAGALTEGTVEFDVYQDGNLASTQSVQLDGTNVANATVPTLPAGTYTVTAAYSDPANNYARSSAALGLAPTIITVAGNGTFGDSGDGGHAQSASLALGNGSPPSVAVDSAGDLFIADTVNNAIREVTPNGVIATVTSGLDQPEGVAVDSQGNLYIADTGANLVQMVNLTGNTETLFGQTVAKGGIIAIAGDGTGSDFDIQGIHGSHSYSPNGSYDGQAATLAPVGSPEAIAVDDFGDVFIAVGNGVRDANNHYYQNAILEVSPNDGIELIAGLAVGRSNSSSPFGSTSLAYDAATQRLYFSLAEGGAVQYLDLNPQSATYQDLFTVTNFTATDVEGLAVDAAGDLYIANSSDNTVQEIAANDIIGGLGQAAAFNVTDLLQNIGVEQTEFNLAKVNVTTIAGNGNASYWGDEGPATVAALSDPTGLAVNAAGDLFIVDTGNYRVREVLPSSPLQVLPAADASDATALASDLTTAVASAPDVTLQATSDSELSTVIQAVNHVTPPANAAPVITVDLAPGSMYSAQTIDLPSGVTLVISANGSTLDPDSPALTVTSGNVIFEGGYATTTDSGNTIYGTSTLTESAPRHGLGHRRNAHHVQRHDRLEHGRRRAGRRGHRRRLDRPRGRRHDRRARRRPVRGQRDGQPDLRLRGHFRSR